MLALGAAQVGLGFWASSSYARTADVVVVMVAGLALARGLADLTAALGNRVTASPAPAAGAAGYVAGAADFAAATARSGRARHRADGAATRPAEAAATSANLDAVLALAAMSGTASGAPVPADAVPGRVSDAATDAGSVSSMRGGVAGGGTATGARLHGGLSAPDDVSSLTTGAEPAAGTATSSFAEPRMIADLSPSGPAVDAPAATARPATMFSPDVPGDDAGTAAEVRPAGPPAGMRVTGAAESVQGTQAATVRISPAAAAAANGGRVTGSPDDRTGRRRAD
jgi:hypothetical protein